MENLIVTLLALIITLAVLVTLRLKKWLDANQRETARQIAAMRDEIRALVDSTGAATVNAMCGTALGMRFPVFLGGPSIDPHHLRDLLFVLQERKPKTILELGSGSSTVVIARALELMDARPERHISVDHEERFLENTRQLARFNHLEAQVEFRCCPLGKVDGFASRWYSGVPEIVGDSKVDLLLIDGPPAYAPGDGLSRAPALPLLRERLGADPVVVLDDANREGETNVVQQWLAAFPEFELYRDTQGKGVAILTLRKDGGDR